MKWWQVDLGIGSQDYNYTVRGDDVVAALRAACKLGALDHTAIAYLHISLLTHAPTPPWEGRGTRARRSE